MHESRSGEYMQDSEEEYFLEAKAADLLRALRSPYNLREMLLSQSHLHTIDLAVWCPERSFEAFLKKCVSWAQHDGEKVRSVER